MENPEIYELLAKYLSNECLSEEKQIVESWIDEKSENKKLFEFMSNTWNSEVTLPEFTDAQSAWNIFESQLNNSKQKSLFLWNNTKLLKYAAVVIFFLVIPFTIFNSDKFTDLFSTQSELITLVATNNSNSDVILSDGSKVKLDIGSTITFPKLFGEKNREVNLKGEAYFNVAHNREKPFIVKSNIGEIKVLGTKFNVRSWTVDNKITVSVDEGKVSLRNINFENEVLLTKGLSSSIIENNPPTEAVFIDLSKHLAWMDGKFYFENTSLNTIFNHLERKLNLKFELTDINKGQEKYNLFIDNSNIENVLQLLKALTDMSYIKTENKIIFN